VDDRTARAGFPLKARREALIAVARPLTLDTVSSLILQPPDRGPRP